MVNRSGSGDELPRRLLTPAEAAAYLGQSERWLREQWQQRRIPAIKLGRAVRYHPEDLDAYIEQHRVAPVREGGRFA